MILPLTERSETHTSSSTKGSEMNIDIVLSTPFDWLLVCVLVTALTYLAYRIDRKCRRDDEDYARRAESNTDAPQAISYEKAS